MNESRPVEESGEQEYPTLRLDVESGEIMLLGCLFLRLGGETGFEPAMP